MQDFEHLTIAELKQIHKSYIKNKNHPTSQELLEDINKLEDKKLK